MKQGDGSLRPADEQELSVAIAEADGPLRVRGGGTRGGPVGGDVLSTAALTGITLYEPGALTLVARAGTPMADVEATLAAENQRLPFEPMDHRALLGTEGEPTIGGAVATNASGPRRIVAGACRDSLIGVRFVDGSGTIIKNGGRVMKNVTGYDLVKLMAGSHGTLGVLTEVSFKVLPGIAATATVTIRNQSPDAAVASMAQALGSPFDVSGAAYSPCGLDGTPVTALRLEGFETSVNYRAERLTSLLDGDIAVETDIAKVSAAWKMIRDCHTLKNAAGDIWRISVKPSDAPTVLKSIDADRYLLDWAGGLIWAEVAQGLDPRVALAGIAGHATLVRAASDRAIPRFHPESAPLAAISRGLRAKFDPRGILNPGLMD